MSCRQDKGRILHETTCQATEWVVYKHCAIAIHGVANTRREIFEQNVTACSAIETTADYIRTIVPANEERQTKPQPKHDA